MRLVSSHKSLINSYENWCFQTVMLEKTLESPLGCKEIKPVNPKGFINYQFIININLSIIKISNYQSKYWLGCKEIKPVDHKSSILMRIDAFKLWCWRRLLRVPWAVRRSNQSILKEINLNIHWKKWCSSWNSSTLATWCQELAHWKERPWCWERKKAKRELGSREWNV